MTRDDLKELGLEKEQIDKIMKKNGEDIEHAKSEKDKIISDKDKELKEKNDTISELNKTIENSKDNAETIKNLQKSVQKYKDAEKERERLAREKQADDELNSKIEEVFGDKKFTSDYVRRGLLQDIKDRHAEDSTLGLKDIFEELTKDKEGIFVNEQQYRINLPKAGNKENEKEYNDKNFF